MFGVNCIKLSMSKKTVPKPPKKITARIQITSELDAATGKAARDVGLSQPSFLGLCIRYGFASARAAALGQPLVMDDVDAARAERRGE